LTPLITEPPRCLRVEDVARALGIGRSTVYDLIRSGRLRSIKIGRRRLVPRDAVEALIARLQEEL
jgi:excisionase family DNA binding protein